MKVFLFSLSFLYLLTSPSFVEAQAKFALPTDLSKLPGKGALRDYEAYLKRWPEFREKWSKSVEADRGSVVFLGDSITQGWGNDFKGEFPGMKLANRGIGGDTTRGILIRLEDIHEINPAAIVMLMGTNDIEVNISPEDAAYNFELIYKELKAKNPDTPLILCRVFPSSEEKDRPKEEITKLNELCESIVRNDSQVTVLDTWTLFANESGDADPTWFKDLLHLNPEGYKRWAAALRPLFATLGFLETESDDFKPEEGFVSLFNGKDLTGWGYRPTPPRKKPKKPRPNALKFVEIKEAESFDGKTISSDGRYEAINGRLVAKTPAEGRRIQQIWTTAEFPSDFILKLEFRATPNADSGVFIRKPQLQCRDFPLAGPYKDLENYKAQDWNEIIITVKGGKAHSTCNGEVLEDAMAVPETGPIGLEGDRGQMEYRRIRMKKLSE